MNFLELLDAFDKIKKFKFQIIAQNANDLICVADHNFKVEYINQEIHKKILGYSLDEFIISFSKLELYHPDEKDKLIESYKDFFNNKKMSLIEWRIKHKNGNYLWFETKGTVYIEDDVKKALFISRDITQRKNTENLLKEAYNKLRTYDRILSHDISNIFQNLSLSIELILLCFNDPNKKEEILDFFNIFRDQVERGKKLIKEERNLSEIDFEFSLKKIEIISILKEAKKFVYSGFPNRNINININSIYDESFVIANDFLLDVFENILINAVKYNNNPIVEIMVNISEDNEYYRLEFIDNGVGIEEEMKKNLFTEIKKKKQKVSDSGGLGIGLVLVKSFIEKFKGKIWVENRINEDYSKGSKFIIIFPKLTFDKK